MTKVALITGASSGFGEACARRFAKSGYALVLLARRKDRLAEIAEELADSVAVHYAELDVRDQVSVERIVHEIPSSFESIDVLINNAGLALGVEPAYEAKLNDWRTMIDTNVNGLAFLTHALLPKMVTRNKGHIVNLGSIAGSWPYPGGNVYCATKAFVSQFSRCLRAELLGKNIRVTCIEPGMAETEFSLVRMKGNDQEAASVYTGTQPLGGEDIADIIHWVVTCPSHVNINMLEVMPLCQAWGPLSVSRNL